MHLLGFHAALVDLVVDLLRHHAAVECLEHCCSMVKVGCQQGCLGLALRTETDRSPANSGMGLVHPARDLPDPDTRLSLRFHRFRVCATRQECS